ncbi:hypothetical protein PF004_g27113 [Phytophthora fragariae]|uniref:OTU domain-containing protein n=1 Tax=Phytophthora fragariae TaxID=53985 RepID=A0A6G0MN82_9STRA|nr:hypothetical protein PF004_g27113 [Phytophthora fragariae]
MQTFNQFKRAIARGRFAALSDPSPEGSELDSEEEEAEAPYAYTDAPRLSVTEDTRTQIEEVTNTSADPMGIGHTETGNGAQNSQGSPTEALQLPGPANTGSIITEISEMDVNAVENSDQESELSGYVGSSAPSCTQSPAPTPGSEVAYSIDLEAEAARERQLQEPDSIGGTALPAAATLGDTQGDISQTPAHSLSQDGFFIAKTAPAPGMPQQLPAFLMPFRGSLISVPANGQCAYTALYATSTSTVETKLTFSSDVVRGANVIKKSVYTLMMTNLANDVACKVVGPCSELRRLYPTQPAPTDVDVATAALFNHYMQERNRSVNTPIPSTFWAGPEVLRAMAQYLREPLFVLDVDQANDAHVQRYFYQDYTLPNGDVHETGCGGAMDDRTAKIMLRAYANLHVLPVFMILKRHEGHFYGVRHGDLTLRWQAEGDLSFAQDYCAHHEWFNEVIAHMEDCQSRTEEIELLADSADTNAFLWPL